MKYQVGIEIEPGPHLVTIETNRLDIAACDAYGGTRLVVRDVFGVLMTPTETPIKCRVVHAHEICEAEPVGEKAVEQKRQSYAVIFRWPYQGGFRYLHRYVMEASPEAAQLRVEADEWYDDDSRVSIEVVSVREEAAE